MPNELTSNPNSASGDSNATPVVEPMSDPHPAAVPRADWSVLPIPRWCRRDRTGELDLGLLAVFAIASTGTVMSIYYVQAVLPHIADTFGVGYSRVAHLPTICQGGYGAGILLISPLGDLVSRRKILLVLSTVGTALSIGLALTESFVAFQVLSFFLAMVSVTPQILLTLTADLSAPERRARSLSIVLSGLLLGIVLARLLSGLIADYSDWQDTYFLATGLEAMILLMLYLAAPDLPSKQVGLSYFGILGTMAKLVFTQPILVQVALIAMTTASVFGSFWATTAFLLSAPPYELSELGIGLFGLAGLSGVLCAPLIGKLVDHLKNPWLGIFIGICCYIASMVIETAAGGLSLAAPVFATMLIDIAMQLVQTSSSTWYFGIMPQMRARANAVYLIAIFAGQSWGSAAGAAVFLDHGWRAASALNLGMLGLALIFLLLRGPHAGRRWLGWHGGFRRKAATGPTPTDTKVDEKSSPESADEPQAEKVEVAQTV